MLNSNVYYHGIMRKSIVAFGSLFSNIYIDRKMDGSTTGTTVQRLQIPIAYAPKEKWLVRIEQDPHLENHTYTTLPRISFEVTSMNYDPTRKVSRMNTITATGTEGQQTLFSPVPYNLEISLYVLTKTQEDALQIVEQILPTFTPEYSLSVMMIEDLSIQQDIPVVLNSVSVQDDYDGDFQTRRFVTYTLNFTMKVNMFGPIAGRNDIRKVYANVVQTGSEDPLTAYEAVVNPIAVNPNTDQYSINSNWTDSLL